jgi:hypothetical protein
MNRNGHGSKRQRRAISQVSAVGKEEVSIISVAQRLGWIVASASSPKSVIGVCLYAEGEDPMVGFLPWAGNSLGTSFTSLSTTSTSGGRSNHRKCVKHAAGLGCPDCNHGYEDHCHCLQHDVHAGLGQLTTR